MLETQYRSALVENLRSRFPGCYIIRPDPQHLQGIPDLLILYKNRWGMLEVKRSASASIRPNQKYYVDIFNDMSFAAFIHPENERSVLDAVQRALGD